MARYGFLFLFLSLMLMGSCGIQKKTTGLKEHEVGIVEAGSDTAEYEITIIDTGFQSWFESHRKPKWYYELTYLENWNYRYVTAWNQKVRSANYQQSHPNNPFDEEINYQPDIKYGLDLNWKLFHYFKYIEETWGQILSPLVP